MSVAVAWLAVGGAFTVLGGLPVALRPAALLLARRGSRPSASEDTTPSVDARAGMSGQAHR
jgi:hypothetical protein